MADLDVPETPSHIERIDASRLFRPDPSVEATPRVPVANTANIPALVDVAASPADVAGSGRAPGFDALYRDRYGAMVRLASILVDTTEEAEQVVQDAFVGLYRRYERVDNPAAYLRTSVMNGARKVLRRRKLFRRTRIEAQPDAELHFDHTFDAIRRLPVEQRELIALRYDQQLTDSEIAATLSMPVGTVKSRLHRALATLRKEIS